MISKIHFIYIFHLNIIFVLSGQANLVMNGSFEEITSCPTSSSQIYLAKFWKSSTIHGTPDLYNSCATNIIISVPSHYGGNYQWPKTGNSYAGIYPFFSGISFEPEFITGELKFFLKKNRNYYINFFISPRISSDPLRVPCYMEGLGIVLVKKDSIYNVKEDEFIPLIPEIKSNGTIIQDTSNWTRISGCVRGNEEKFIYIGNFKSNKTTLVDPLCHTSFPNKAYYYIDDVGVYEFDPLPDTINLCKEEKKRIGAQFLDGTYLWNTGERDSIITINKSGTYILNIQMENCTLSDTVIVLNPEEEIEKQESNLLLCKNESIKLEVPINGLIKWSTGALTKSIEVNSSGEYICEIINECGLFTKTYTINLQECDCHFFAPNVFSPNGDNVNDNFELKSNCNLQIKILNFTVYNRWGELIFRNFNNDPNSLKWNPKLDAKKILPGVYVWNIVYEYISDSKIIRKNQSGDVTILY